MCDVIMWRHSVKRWSYSLGNDSIEFLDLKNLWNNTKTLLYDFYSLVNRWGTLVPPLGPNRQIFYLGFSKAWQMQQWLSRTTGDQLKSENTIQLVYNSIQNICLQNYLLAERKSNRYNTILCYTIYCICRPSLHFQSCRDIKVIEKSLDSLFDELGFGTTFLVLLVLYTMYPRISKSCKIVRFFIVTREGII